MIEALARPQPGLSLEESRWILIGARRGCDAQQEEHLGVQAVFQSGNVVDALFWVFPRMSLQKVEEAFLRLQAHIGDEVTSITELPPHEVWIHFADGSKWGVFTPA